MTYTLIFGNNFISDNPKSVTCNGTTLFSLGEDTDGPHLTAKLIDLSANNVKLSIDKNHCTFCAYDLILKKNARSHILIDNKEGENVIQSRILDASTIFVSGMFAIKDSVSLVVTQNYIISPSGKKIMHSRICARNGSISITNNGIVSET
jgi:hypothetical protein